MAGRIFGCPHQCRQIAGVWALDPKRNGGVTTNAIPLQRSPSGRPSAAAASISGRDSMDIPIETTMATPESDLDLLFTMRDQFAASGLHYTDEQIATFYTSLQTKGFVVLSGISGTGKSKIATGFVEMLPDLLTTSIISLDTSGLIPISVLRYMRKSKRVPLPSRYVYLLPPLRRRKPTSSFHHAEWLDRRRTTPAPCSHRPFQRDGTLLQGRNRQSLRRTLARHLDLPPAHPG